MKAFMILLFFFSGYVVFSQNLKEITSLIEKGDEFCQSQKYEKGIENYSKALKFNQNVSEIYQKRGNAFFAVKKYRIAISDYSNALSNNPNNPEIIYIMRGLLKSLLENEDKKGACEDFRKAKKLGYDLKEMKGLNEYCGTNDLE